MKLYREVNQIRSGWYARSAFWGLAAHGYSPEVADKNLERVIRQFFAPFQREGTLGEEMQALGLAPIGEEEERLIVLEWGDEGPGRSQ